MKKNAHEYLKIKILSVKEQAVDNCRIDIVYKAEVMDVYRSDSQLCANDEIVIHSWNMKNSSACAGGGPRLPPVLTPGWIGKAFLNHTGKKDSIKFNIAAFGESFEEINRE